MFSGQRPTPPSPFSIEFPPVVVSGVGNEQGTIVSEGQGVAQPKFSVGVLYLSADLSRTVVCRVSATDEGGRLRTDGRGKFSLTSVAADSKVSNGYRFRGTGHFEDCPVTNSAPEVVGSATAEVEFK